MQDLHCKREPPGSCLALGLHLCKLAYIRIINNVQARAWTLAAYGGFFKFYVTYSIFSNFKLYSCEMKDIYNDSTYLEKNPTWHEEDAPFKTDKILKLLGKSPVSFKTVAEIGCGSGEILVQLNKKLQGEYSFYGFDISKDAIGIAKKKETDKIKFELRDITVKEDTSYFDMLLVIDVIEHIENYFDFLRGIVTKSKYTIFHIPLDMYVWSLFREGMLIESKDRVGHIHNFTEDFIISILNDIGFKTIDKIYTEPYFELITFKQKLVGNMRKALFSINKRFCTKTLGGYSVLVLTENHPA